MHERQSAPYSRTGKESTLSNIIVMTWTPHKCLLPQACYQVLAAFQDECHHVKPDGEEVRGSLYQAYVLRDERYELRMTPNPR